ncbi:transporter substrate-binding domain-containing protein [Duganella sp. LX20W]|uniref:Transporter substrate-binding domain-containing protein n=1 Tax=Rugamonas brunnea TaxID=2758569 RepID=A0A7W2IA62_9BURK|nr:transporter substrate-binding domain-containing protein [Rugamonas brunnea]MBA5635924.1 transporter substrate-binding domain-containing protein [Rugamonas brunnea]
MVIDQESHVGSDGRDRVAAMSLSTSGGIRRWSPLQTAVQLMFCVASLLIAKVAYAGADLEILTSEIAGMAEKSATPGSPHGIALDMLDAIGDEAGLSVSYHFLPWLRAQKMVQYRPGTLIAPLTRTSERESHYLWITHLYDYHQVLLTMAPNRPPATIAEAANQRIGVLRSSAGVDLLEKLGVHYQAGETETMNALKLAAGRIDVWMVPDVVALPSLRHAKLDPGKFLVGGTVGATGSIYLAASPAFDPALAGRLRDAAARAAHKKKLQAIQQRYQLRSE